MNNKKRKEPSKMDEEIAGEKKIEEEEGEVAPKRKRGRPRKVQAPVKNVEKKVVKIPPTKTEEAPKNDVLIERKEEERKKTTIIYENHSNLKVEFDSGEDEFGQLVIDEPKDAVEVIVIIGKVCFSVHNTLMMSMHHLKGWGKVEQFYFGEKFLGFLLVFFIARYGREEPRSKHRTC